ncbi:MAG: GGDEF domain-containing protein [Rhodocyclales bacterium]|nr:GGDEF domain-containing protein [Rhodocyclales bacterium]
MNPCIENELDELSRIVHEGLLQPVFQPIVDFRARTLLGYEALIRGPLHSPLQRPDVLFSAARAAGLGLDLEHACRETSLRAFARLQLPGRLFLNSSPGALLDERMMNGATRALLGELGIAANRIVIELTENEQITDLPGIQEALLNYRGRGFQIAIDDLGEGFANLRMWSEIRPEFVKIDKHFVHGIADDRIKYHFVRAMQDLGEICNAALIAEGIERVEDFECIRDMGIACGQGFFIARPDKAPARKLPAAVAEVLDRHRVTLSPTALHAGKTRTARLLLRPIDPVSADASNECVFARFEADASLEVLPVVEGSRPIGLINRHSMVDRFARPFQKELFGRKSCHQFMDPAPLIVDQNATIPELAMMLSVAPRHYLFDGFIITGDGGRYLGIGSSHDLVAMITEMQISAARYANPLTQLPGNVPINEHIDRMLATGNGFVVAYLDIDSFKPYNDTFGYRRGDDVIQLLGQLICEAVDGRQDFVGHIGGDDFFVVFQSADWEVRCWEVVGRFAESMATMADDELHASGGYLAENRRGELVQQALPTLSIGVVRVDPGEFESHREVAAAASTAKKQAKKSAKQAAAGMTPGQAQGAVFVERRRPAGEAAAQRLN